MSWPKCPVLYVLFFRLFFFLTKVQGFDIQIGAMFEKKTKQKQKKV